MWPALLDATLDRQRGRWRTERASGQDIRALRFRTDRAVHRPPRAVFTPREFNSPAAALLLSPASSPSSSGKIRAANSSACFRTAAPAFLAAAFAVLRSLKVNVSGRGLPSLTPCAFLAARASRVR